MAIGHERHAVLVFRRDSAGDLAGIVHDLRTPLAAIVGAAERLLETDPTPAERATEARTIAQAGRGLLVQVEGLLGADPSRADRSPRFWSPVEIASEAVELLGPTARAKRLDLVLVESGRVSPRPGDPTPFRRILVNLVGNAIKFSGRGAVEVTIADRAGDLVASVRDQGPGIDPGLLPRLFRAGIRGESAASDGIDGHGLGLANVRELAVSMGGTIKVESRLGEGSTFTVTLPRAVRATRLDGVRVLLVEDDEDNRRLLLHHLRAAGAEVQWAEDGFRAERIARTSSPDVILLDLALPGRDGPATLEALRSCGVIAPALALTASTDAATHGRAIKAGFHRILTKPIDRESLALAIRDALVVRAAA